MMSRKSYRERDELRGRFTRFLEITVRRARQNYLKNLSRRPKEVSLDELPEALLLSTPEPYPHHNDTFDFTEERLAAAFSSLPLMRQRILYLLFWEEKKPAEIAQRLHCSVQHVYNQRSLALKKLRKLLMEGDDMW